MRIRRADIGSVAVVFGGALALRLLAISAVVDPATAFDKFPLLARTLIANGWVVREPFAYSPAYIYFVAVLLRFGASLSVLVTAQAVMGALSCVAVWGLARRLFGSTVALVAGIGAAIYGPFLVYSLTLESDALGLLCFCAVGLVLLSALEAPVTWRLVLAGGLIGLRAIQRPDGLLLLFLVLAGMALGPGRAWGVRRTAAAMATLGLAALAPIVPIAALNARASHELIPVTSSAGWVFYTSQNSAAAGLSYFPPPLAWERMNAPLPPVRGNTGGSSGPDAREGRDLRGDEAALDRLDDRVSRRLASLALERDVTPGEASRFWAREGLRAVARRGAARQLALQVRKLFYLLHAYEAHDSLPLLVEEERLGLATIIGMGILAPLALLGLLRALRDREFRSRRRLPLAAFLLTPVISMSLFYVGSRFRLELAAMLLPFAASALVRLAALLRARRWRAAGVAVALAAVLGFLLHIPDQEIRKQQRLRFIQLHTFLGVRSSTAGEAGREFAAAAGAARYPAEAQEALLGWAKAERALGDEAAARREESLASGVLDDDTLKRLEAMKHDPEALWAVGRHFMLRGLREPALEALSRAARAAPDNPDVLFAQAVASVESGRAAPEAVAASLERALDGGLRFSNNAGPAYALLASCYERLGKTDAAQKARVRSQRYQAFLDSGRPASPP